MLRGIEWRFVVGCCWVAAKVEGVKVVYAVVGGDFFLGGWMGGWVGEPSNNKEAEKWKKGSGGWGDILLWSR